MTIFHPTYRRDDDGEFTVLTADDGAVVTRTTTHAAALEIIAQLQARYSLTKDIAGTWRVRRYLDRVDNNGHPAGMFTAPGAAHAWIARDYQVTHPDDDASADDILDAVLDHLAPDSIADAVANGLDAHARRTDARRVAAAVMKSTINQRPTRTTR